MLRVPVAVVIASWLAVAACSGGPQAQPAEAPKSTPAAASDEKATPPDNPQCKLFTPAEIERFIGEPVSGGQNAALGSGCQWLAADGSGDVIVAVVPASYHEAPVKSEGYKALTDVGSQGYVAPQADGWVAGAVVGEDAIRVSVAGNSATEATAVSLLKETVKRRAQPSGRSAAAALPHA